MTSKLLLLAGAAALVLSSAAAEPPHGPNPNCPPGQHDCAPATQSGQQAQGRGHQGQGMQGQGMQGQGMQGQGMQGQSMQGHDRQGRGLQGGPNNGPGGWQGGPNWRGGSGPQGSDWHWQDNNGWHRDHDRYWRPNYGAFAGFDRIFFDLRRHHFDRVDGQPYWFHGRYVVRTFDRSGRVVFVEVNPYTGAFIGVVQFRD